MVKHKPGCEATKWNKAKANIWQSVQSNIKHTEKYWFSSSPSHFNSFLPPSFQRDLLRDLIEHIKSFQYWITYCHQKLETLGFTRRIPGLVNWRFSGMREIVFLRSRGDVLALLSRFSWSCCERRVWQQFPLDAQKAQFSWFRAGRSHFGVYPASESSTPVRRRSCIGVKLCNRLVSRFARDLFVVLQQN